MANNSLTTNFNTSPYYDDFNEDKRFHRILFKPGLAVQARELTQMQTILQNQIDRNAEHIFKEGAIVREGKTNVDLDYYFIKVRDEDELGNALNINELVGTLITSANTGLNAVVINAVDGDEESDPDTKTLFVKYTSSSIDGNIKVFANTDFITSNTGVTFRTIDTGSAVGTGSALTVDAGILYAKDHFIKFEKQTIVLNKYSNTPTAKVGFLVAENIVDANDDFTLLDPAQGSYNYAAPGADRLQLIPSLIKFEDGDIIPEDFIQVLEIKDGIIQQLVTRTEYSIIRDEFARRTYDESGDYTVNGLKIRVREHLNDGTNNGLFYANTGGNNLKLAVGVEPGKAYVRGYEVEKLVTDYVAIDKGIDFKDLETQSVAANYGNYVLVKELVGDWNVNDAITVDLHDAASQKITNRLGSGSPSGSKIGTAVLKTLEYNSGVQGTAASTYRAYLTDLKMTAGAFSAVRSIYYNNPSTADVNADIVTPSVFQEQQFNTSIYRIPVSNIRRLRDENNEVETTYMFKKKFDISIAIGGTFTVNTGSVNEIFPFSNGALNSTQKRENFILVSNSSATVSLSGTISATTTTVTGSGTTFTNLNVGDKILIASNSNIRTIVSIASNTSMVIDAAPSGTVSGSAFSKQYLVGDIIDLSTKGATGVEKTATVTSATSISFDLKETLSGTVSASIITNLRKVNAQEIKKILRKNRYVVINPNTNTGGLTGPWSLGVPDVIKINSVRRHTSTFASASDGVLVTDSITLDNGQRDNIYDHARIRNTGGLTINSSHYLLVNLDYFYHDTTQGVGYYSVDSYPIDDVNGIANNSAITTKEIPIFSSSLTGETYNLRDCIDTRIVKTITASDSTTVGGASTNPAESTSFVVPSGGVRFAAPNEEFIFDYSYYLPRKDTLVINKDGRVTAVRGIPDSIPAAPDPLDETMTLAIIHVAPFPSLPTDLALQYNRPNYANKIENVAIRRYTMKDINVLDKRITNVEYYVTLSMLEKDTLDTKIVDENGLDRFKNGILVDPFNDHGVGDTNNPDYHIAVDAVKSEIRPFFELDDIGMVYKTNTNLFKSSSVIYRPYAQTTYAQNLAATTTRNTAGLFYNYVGEIDLTPESDYWVNTTQLPDLQVVNNVTVRNQTSSVQVNQATTAWGANWDSWSNAIVGTSVTAAGNIGPIGNIRVGQSTVNSTSASSTSITRAATSTVTSSTSSTSQNLGNKVVDVSVIPFIRQQRIKFYAAGLKPTTRLYAFFDGENVTTYCRKLSSTGVVLSSVLTTETNGVIYGDFLIPNNSSMKFRTGTLIFRLTDSSTNETDAGLVTTSCQTQFTASGLNQTKQNTVVTTRTTTVTTNTVTGVTVRANAGRNGDPSGSDAGGDGSGGRGNNDPIGQTFKVSLDNEEGIFVSSVVLYFASKHPTYGAVVELREVDSAGHITSTMLPGSRITLPPASISVSANGSAGTVFNFPDLIFLLNNTEYAIVVKPQANNDQTTVWVSKLGRTDILTGSKITKQPFSGSLFVSSNDGIYEPVQDEDLKFSLRRADFTIGSGNATFVNEPWDFLTLSSTSGQFQDIGEVIKGETRGVVSNVTGGSISLTDKIVGQTSNAEGSVTYISGSNFRLKTVTGEYENGESFLVRYANNAAKGVTGTLVSTNTPTGLLMGYEATSANTQIMDVKKLSSTAFLAGEQLVGEDSAYTATIGSFRKKIINVANPQSSEVVLFNTAIDWEIRTADEAGTLSGWIPIPIGRNIMFDTERFIHSASELTETLQMRATLTNAVAAASPMVNTNRCHTVYIHNLINNDATGENGKNGGNAMNRYITQKVTLAEGQDAEDLKLFLTAYRPPNSDIKVYGKFLNGNDSDNFDDTAWLELEMTSKSLFSDYEDIDDFKEFEFSLPDSVLTGSNDEFQYVNSKSVTFTGYKYFAIKIVLLGESSVDVPRGKDMRAICLQK